MIFQNYHFSLKINLFWQFLVNFLLSTIEIYRKNVSCETLRRKINQNSLFHVKQYVQNFVTVQCYSPAYENRRYKSS